VQHKHPPKDEVWDYFIGIPCTSLGEKKTDKQGKVTIEQNIEKNQNK